MVGALLYQPRGALEQERRKQQRSAVRQGRRQERGQEPQKRGAAS